MIKYSSEVFGYVPHEVKARLKRIKNTNREYTESYLIKLGLERVVPEVEKELGILGPVKVSRKEGSR